MEENISILEAETEDEAQDYLFDYRIDLFILDIILMPKAPGDVSGIRFAEKVRKIESYLFTPIIFTTALEDPKWYAFQNLHGFSYLEKPFSMKKAVELIALALKYPGPQEKRRVEYFRKDGILIAVNLRKVTHVEACRHTLTIYTEDERLDIPYITIRHFLKLCRNDGFFQCSRSAAINRNFIRSIDLPRRYIQLKTGILVEIGPSFVKKLKAEKKKIY